MCGPGEGEGAIWGDIVWPILKYMEYLYLACSQYYQPYLVGGTSDVAFYCQYCSNVF